ncbi:FHA domain-containing protein, partial [Streptomyces alkaliphilus]|uniref:FHA domain-containing protein n=1 Tax=Streptomyces alkaliphilus TaxID=1472722 RepID=UPI001180AD83
PPVGYPDPGPPTARTEVCPRCRTPREIGATYCAECGHHSPPGTPAGSHGHGAPTPAPVGHWDPRPTGAPSGYGGPPPPPAPPPGPPPVPPPPVPGGEQRTGDWLLTPPGGPTPGTGSWMLDIAPDHDYFTAMMRRSGPEAARLRMPGPGGGQRILLEGPQMSIGRTRPSTGEAPDIDLSRPPEDPGVSHQHALLVRQPDHTWTIVDQGSTNGTTVNYEEEPIPPYVPVPLREGDRVHVGAWTTLTIHRG